MARTAPSLGRVAAAAALLLGALAAALVLVGQPSSAGIGPLALPHPVPLSAVRYDEPPLKVLLVGDSMAGSLGVGIGGARGHVQRRAGQRRAPRLLAVDGRADPAHLLGRSPGPPCVGDHPGALLAAWQAWVDAFRPDVVVYLGRSDLLNQKIHGRWTWIGHRDFNHWFYGTSS